MARFHHHLSNHLVDLSVVNRVGNIIRESSRCDVAIHHNSYLVVIAHETLLRQHSMKGMEAHAAQSDGRGRDVQEFNALRAFKGSMRLMRGSKVQCACGAVQRFFLRFTTKAPLRVERKALRAFKE